MSNSRPPLKGILTGWQGIQLSDRDGQFQIAVLPGPGHLLVHAESGSYILREVGSSLLSSGKPGGQRYYAHAILKIDPTPDAKSLELTIELQPGASIAGRIVDEQGQPVQEAVVVSRLDIWSHWLSWHGKPQPAPGGKFELTGLKDGIEYPTHFLDPKRRLGATVQLNAGEKEPTVILKSCGSALARFVDDKGQPLADYSPTIHIVVTSGTQPYDYKAMQAGALSADSDFAANIDRLNHGDLKTDAAGKLTIPALNTES